MFMEKPIGTLPSSPNPYITIQFVHENQWMYGACIRLVTLYVLLMCEYEMKVYQTVLKNYRNKNKQNKQFVILIT